VYTDDGGQSIEDVSGQLVSSAVGGMVGEPTGRFVFASTSLGPLVFDVEAKTWFDLADGDVPWFDGRRVEYIESINTVRFSTWGSGIWDFQIGGCDSPIDVDAGGAETQEDAESACPELCEQVEGTAEGEWNGHFWHDEDGASWCQCCVTEEDGPGPGTETEEPSETGNPSEGETEPEESDSGTDGGGTGAGESSGDDGCGCSSGGGAGPLPLAAFFLVGGAIRRRRSRRAG
jgi:MYXO-CTERM domain-containing protein